MFWHFCQHLPGFAFCPDFYLGRPFHQRCIFCLPCIRRHSLGFIPYVLYFVNHNGLLESEARRII
jgi:hypothetical protein